MTITSEYMKVEIFELRKWCEETIDHRSITFSSCGIQAWKKKEKKSGLNGIRTYDLGDTGAVLYQLSHEANWELMGAGARFSKLPVITGPVKLLCFPSQMGVPKALNIIQ